MELKLSLEHTGQTWTLKPNRRYIFGSRQDCDIVLPYPTAVDEQHLACFFDPNRQIWSIQDLNSRQGTTVDRQLIKAYSLIRQTRITLGNTIVLIATPLGSSPALADYMATSATSARLISGTAYRLGLRDSLFLLNALRADPYKAKSPETSLNLEEIATHAAQSVALSLLCVGIAIGVILLQLFSLWIEFGFWQGIGVWIHSGGFTWLSDPATSGLEPTVFLFLRFSDAIAAAIVAYEIVYMRWSIARRFIKNRYQHNFRINFLAHFTQFLKRRILQSEPSQNAIVFGGFSPFLGSGTPISNSDITVSVHRHYNDHSSPTPEVSVDIPVGEFYQAIDQEVAKLKLPNLQVLSHLYIKGFELNADGNVLKQPLARPAAILPEEQVWLLGHGDLASERRVYRVYRYVDTARDNVLSYFVRFYNIGSITFVEAVAYGLTSFDRKYFSLAPVLGEYILCRVIKTGLVAVLFAQFRLYLIPAVWQFGIFLINAFVWWRNDLRQRRAARLQEEYNYGPELTFREAIAAPFDSSYYGNQDLVMYWRAIQQALFAGIISVLKKHNVDTSQFEKSAASIINYGVMVTGGQLNASQVAAGRGVQGIINSVQGAAASAVGLSATPSTLAKPNQSTSPPQPI